MVNTVLMNGSWDVKVWLVIGTPPASVRVTVHYLPIGSLSVIPGGAIEPGTGSFGVITDQLEILDAVWFKGNLWLTFDDGCVPSGDTVLESCFRLIEINTRTLIVKQNFDVGKKGFGYYYPALSADSLGDLTVVFGFSSSTIYPSVVFTRQLAGASPDTLGTPVTLKLGSADANAFNGRWGDYYGAAPAPSSTATWVVGEYAAPLDYWLTWVAEVTR